ncbi:MAG TPA: hypothetical protein VND93_22865 [Myxococcales bacterium]|jgi:hypothetical protein|nr:hypothetical protein [Myxococcales bacterium]
MPSPEFEAAFSALKSIFATHARRLDVKADTTTEYTVVARTPSPFPRHKGQPLFFGSVRLGKAYVSFHLLALYMSPELKKGLSPALKKRMQGKACFNFKAPPEKPLLAELKRLTGTGVKAWVSRGWL